MLLIFTVKFAVENCIFICFEVDELVRDAKDRTKEIQRSKIRIEVVGESNLQIKPLYGFLRSTILAITNDGNLIAIASDGTCYNYKDAKWNLFNSVPGYSESYYCDMKAVTLPEGIHLFRDSMYNFLHNNSVDWINRSVENWSLSFVGSMLALPENKIVKIHALNCVDQFEILDVESVKCYQMPPVPPRWYRALGAIIGYFKNQIFMTGGCKILNYGGVVCTGRTLIYSLPNFSAIKGPDLNVARNKHGMGIICIGGVSKLIVFGGVGVRGTLLDSIEEWDEQEHQWKMSKIKLSEPNICIRYCFKSVVN